MDQVRKKILAKLAELEMPLKEASLKIGKNHAYLQQFIHRGVPAHLPEKARRHLAALLNVAEVELGGPPPLANYEKSREPRPAQSLGSREPGEVVLKMDVGIGPEEGLLAVDAYLDPRSAEHVRARWQIPEAVTGELLKAPAQHIRALEVVGDSMAPILCEHDRAFVDLRSRNPHPAGIFALFDGYALVIKRLQIVAGSEPLRLNVLSVNPAYAAYERVLEEVRIIGRVVGRFTASLAF